MSRSGRSLVLQPEIARSAKPPIPSPIFCRFPPPAGDRRHDDYFAGDKAACVLSNFSSLTMTADESLSYHNASMTAKANTNDLKQEIADLESHLHNAKLRLESSSSSAPVLRSDKVSPWSHGNGSNGRETRAFLLIFAVAKVNRNADYDFFQWTSSAQPPSMHCSSYRTLRSH